MTWSSYVIIIFLITSQWVVAHDPKVTYETEELCEQTVPTFAAQVALGIRTRFRGTPFNIRAGCLETDVLNKILEGGINHGTNFPTFDGQGI
jgi:hypothetical protein